MRPYVAPTLPDPKYELNQPHPALDCEYIEEDRAAKRWDNTCRTLAKEAAEMEVKD